MVPLDRCQEADIKIYFTRAKAISEDDLGAPEPNFRPLTATLFNFHFLRSLERFWKETWEFDERQAVVWGKLI
jgi:hypothetical protein